MEQATLNKINLIKNIYYYLVSFVTLMMITFSAVDLISSTLRTYIFTKADNYSYISVLPECTNANDPAAKKITPEECAKQEAQQKQNQEEMRVANLQNSMVRDISMIIVGLPLFILHWKMARKKQ